MGDLKVYGPDGEVWGWSQRWVFYSVPEFTLVCIPQLHLAPKPTYRLVHVRGYQDVFEDCRFCGPGLVFPLFQVYGAVFPFYKTGRPELRQVVTTLKGGYGNLSRIIQVATELLT